MVKTVSFIGLGAMGFFMAGHIAKSTFKVRAFDLNRERLTKWHEANGASIAASPAEATDGADFLVTSVRNDADLRDLAYGDAALLAVLKPGAIWIDHTSASAEVARDLARRAAEREVGFVDAPVSGGTAGSEKGALSIMAGGSEDDFKKALHVLSCYATTIELMGGVGAGQITKMANQICIGSYAEGIAEALNFARAAGLDMKKVINVLSKGGAQSFYFENRASNMVAGQFADGFAVDLMRKDLGLCLNEARRMGIELPATELIDALYADIQQMGGGSWDNSSLIARYI